jgi:uncharacterized protein (TIGR02266 family)
MSTAAVDSAHPDLMRQPAPRPGRTAVEIAVDLHTTEGPTPGVTRDISPDGAFVATSRVLPVGARLLMMLALPGERRPMAVRAEVRWSRHPAAAEVDHRRPSGMGLRFVDPPLGVALSIADLVEARRAERDRDDR